MRWLLFLILICVVAFFSCSREKKHAVSFYYWKQDFGLSRAQESILELNKVKKLYVKFFDVTWNSRENKAIPISKIDFKKPAGKYKIVPCIFIENQVFKQDLSPEIASKVYELIRKIAKTNKFSIQEIQIDCDWTDATRKAYFSFLSKLTALAKNKQLITSTLRLHQFKYPKKTGIPPVQKAVLMCYNMGKIDNQKTANSIISEAELKKYILDSEEYPLPLDLALPSYHWGLIYRLGKLTLIVNDIDRNSIKSFKFSILGENKFRADSSFYFNNTYFCKNDILRIEESKPSTLMGCAQILQKSKHHFNEVIFYHISSNSISNYEKSFFSNLTSYIH
jgi:hypothetical protein